MSRIVYGVSGEGSGHSSRARELAGHLLALGHEVRLVSYDRGYRNLCEDFDVFETEGLTIASADNRVSVVHTFTENLKRLPAGHRKLQQLKQTLFEDFQPHCVVTDFEPMTAYLAHHFDRPLISVDNQHRMRYVELDCPPGLENEARVAKMIIRAIVPRPDVSLVTALFPGPTSNDRTFVFPPIVRSSVRDQTATDAGHILVYLTSGFDSFLDTLDRFPRERFVVYGQDERPGMANCTFKPPSQLGFVDDLASARAVMATAGFTLISEAFYLGKPYLAMPMDGQFEQELNAFQLEQLGYGKSMPAVHSDAIGDFLYRLPDYRESLVNYLRSDNSEIKHRLAELVAEDARSADEYRQKRLAS